MIDLATEHPLSLAAAAALIPPARGGRKTHLSTLLRWILTGAKAPDGSVVRLEGIRIGGRWLTSREALRRFSERLTPSLGGAPEPATRQTPAQRRKAAAAADETLAAMGA